ncbi:MAG: right-handed parallel beta-helix repeat-containing protein, partial [Planctomycetota bacterium]
FLALSAGLAQGGTITVGPGGGYDFSSVQAAINAAGWHDTVIVYPHTYYENIDFLGKAITVKSINPQDPNIVAGTVIDAGGLGSVVTFRNGEGPDAVITGFTITGGGDGTKVSYYMYYGSGICCYYASPTITRNVISGNIGLNDDGEIINTWGGGIGCVSSNAIIARNVIKENEAYLGGGIYIQDEGDVGANVTITNNVITGNESSEGAGIGVLSGDAMIANSLMCGN